jgi:splicing factor 3B subunit 3
MRKIAKRTQVVIALSGSQIIYFELNMNGQLLEVEKKELADEVACLDIAEVPEGRQRASFVVVGCYDNTVRVLSLEPSECLKAKATQQLSALPESAMLLSASISAAGMLPSEVLWPTSVSRVVAIHRDVVMNAYGLRDRMSRV